MEDQVWISKDKPLEESSFPLNSFDAAKEKESQRDSVHDDEKGPDVQYQETIPGYKRQGLVYGVEDRPPFQIALVCAFQVCLNFSG